MNTIDLSPLYRSSVGFDRIGSLLDSALRADTVSTGYPPYNIEAESENNYSISLALAGFKKEELDINVDRGVLTISGKKKEAKEKTYLHKGIAFRSFERKFNLAEHIKVVGADFADGMLSVNLERELPEQLKPRSIAINSNESAAVLPAAENDNSDQAA